MKKKSSFISLVVFVVVATGLTSSATAFGQSTETVSFSEGGGGHNGPNLSGDGERIGDGTEISVEDLAVIVRDCMAIQAREVANALFGGNLPLFSGPSEIWSTNRKGEMQTSFFTRFWHQESPSGVYNLGWNSFGYRDIEEKYKSNETFFSMTFEHGKTYTTAPNLGPSLYFNQTTLVDHYTDIGEAVGIKNVISHIRYYDNGNQDRPLQLYLDNGNGVSGPSKLYFNTADFHACLNVGLGGTSNSK